MAKNSLFAMSPQRRVRTTVSCTFRQLALRPRRAGLTSWCCRRCQCRCSMRRRRRSTRSRSCSGRWVHCRTSRSFPRCRKCRYWEVSSYLSCRLYQAPVAVIALRPATPLRGLQKLSRLLSYPPLVFSRAPKLPSSAFSSTSVETNFGGKWFHTSQTSNAAGQRLRTIARRAGTSKRRARPPVKICS
jgi:hypothetical protein